ncbi:XrtA/PEP-CTERM system TPR-repeat protein PrsT [Lentisalinibacter salinarum]|uniref:XrtA/PEP-CTERM system TPR-repeat protein PrsT n=1 Tax=Lentisalinibacter salinarum TaxID=2992239 RepID=UPI003865327A
MPSKFRNPSPGFPIRFLVVGILALSAGCGLALTNEARLERAQEAYGEGDYRAAIIDLRNVLQQEPDNRQARLLLGRAALQQGDVTTAEKELRRAIELGAPLEAVAVDLGRTLLGLRQFNQLLEEIHPDLTSDEAERREILRLRADAHMGLGLPETARDIYLEVLESDPADLRSRLGVASSHVAQDQYADARRVVGEILAMDPNFAPAWLASGSLNLTTGDIDSAIADFVKASEVADAAGGTSDKVSALIGLVEARLANQDLAGGKQAVEELQNLAPDNLTTKYLTARVAFLEGDYETAQSELAEILSAAPEYRPAQFLMGAVHLRRGNLGQAEMHLSAVVAAAPDSVDARRLLAETRLRQDRADEAAEILRPVLDSDDDNVAALGLAVRASLAAGQYDNAIAFLEQSLEKDPDNVERKLDLVSAYLAAGRIDSAEAMIDSLPEEAGESSYRRDLLQVMTPLRRGDPASALREAEAMAERWPEDARVRNLMGGIALSMDRPDQARESFTAAQQLAPDAVASYVNLARIEAREGNLAEAKAQYRAALEHAPEAANIMVALAQLEARTENRSAAMEWLEKARDVDAGALAPRLLLARLLLADREFEKARLNAEEAVALDRDNAEAHNLLGLARTGLGEHSQAAASFERAVELDSDELSYRMNEARAQMALGNAASAERTIREAGGGDPDNLRASLVLAATRARQGDIEGAMRIAKNLQSRHPEEGLPYALEGELLASSGDFEAAAAAYERALELREDDRRLVLRAFRIRSQGDLPEPEQPLLAYLEERPLDADMRVVVAQRYQTGGQSDRAIAEYEQVLETAPENFVALNNLAWEYFQSGDPRAEDIARRAYEQAPDNGSVADTLGWIQVNTGKLDEGISTLRRAMELSNGRAQVTYHLAAALARAGEPAEARALLEDVLSSGQDFASQEEAEQLLESL